MRKSFYCAVLLALSLASCQKSESVQVSGDGFIGFDPYISRDFTKAAVTDVTALNLATFNVACYLTGSATPYFISEQSTNKNSDGYWETEDHYCWPEDATKLDFFAYLGSGSGAVSNTGGVAKVSYTVPDAATEDFIVAYAVNQGKPSAYPYIQYLSFSHALSKVRQLTFSPKTGDACANSKYRYVVTDVRITGAQNSADYTFNPASGSNWGTASGDKDYEFEDKSFSFLGDSSHKLEVGTDSKVNDQLIILPQTATFSVTYSVEYTYDGGTTWTEIMESTTKMTDVEMEAGKAYTLKFQLPNDASPVVFSVEVSDWDAEEVDKEVKGIFLPGEFSVSAEKKVNFTKGNLYWNGSKFKFEDDQTTYVTTWDESHVGLFFWSKTASVAYAAYYSDPSKSITDEPFCVDMTVCGVNGLYVLSKAEWEYLLTKRTVNGGTGEGKSYRRATVCSVYGVIIYPDDYTAQTSATSYDASTWKTMEEAGCVFLCQAGLRNGTSILYCGSCGQYWSSTNDKVQYSMYYCYYMYFSGTSPSLNSYTRNYGGSIRLVRTAL